MSGPLFFPLVLFALLPLCAAGNRRAIGWMIGGSFLVILGCAALAPEWEVLATAPTSFLAVSAGFIWAGLALIGIGSWETGRDLPRLTVTRIGIVLGSTLAHLVTVAVILHFLFKLRPALLAGSWQGVLVALGLGVSGAVLAKLAQITKLATGVRKLDEKWLIPHREPMGGMRRLPVTIALVIGLVTTWIAPQLMLASLGALIAAIAGFLLARGEGKGFRAPLQPILALIGLGIFCWFVATIAGGDISLAFPGILDTPFSETAEATLALFLGLGTWALLGLWPFHGNGVGSLLALAGGALLLKWGVALIPNGMAHAAPIFAIIAVLSALHAALVGRPGEYAAALGVLALGSPQEGVWVFFAIATVAAATRIYELTPRIPGIDRRELVGIALIPTLAATLPMSLRGEAGPSAIAVMLGVALFAPSRH